MLTPGELWTNVHLGTAILSACLPTFPPLISRLRVLGSAIVSRMSSFFGTLRPSEKETDQCPLKNYDKLTGPALEAQSSKGAPAGRSTSGHGEPEWEAYRITVEKTVHIV